MKSGVKILQPLMQNPETPRIHQITVMILHAADYAQMMTLVISMIGYVPQLVKIVRGVDTFGISMSTWLLWTTSAGLALFYGAAHYFVDDCCGVLALTSCVNFLLTLGTLLALVARRKASPYSPPQTLGQREIRN